VWLPIAGALLSEIHRCLQPSVHDAIEANWLYFGKNNLQEVSLETGISVSFTFSLGATTHPSEEDGINSGDV
jgi:hypothetical protein